MKILRLSAKFTILEHSLYINSVMAFTENESAQYQSILEQYLEQVRPPAEIRAKLDIGYDIEGQSIYLVEIRPQWRNPEVIQRLPYAKATFVRSKNQWNIYWMRSDLKWYAYDPLPKVKTLERFLKTVHEDAYHCFKESTAMLKEKINNDF